MSKDEFDAVKRSDAPKLEELQTESDGSTYFVLAEFDNDHGWIATETPVTAER